MTNKERVQKAALEVLAEQSKGIHYSPLQAAVRLKLPDVPPNTIQGNTWDLEAKIPDLVSESGRTATPRATNPCFQFRGYSPPFRGLSLKGCDTLFVPSVTATR
jgi:hypothetical protein